VQNEKYKTALKFKFIHLQIFLVEQNLPKTINRFLSSNLAKQSQQRRKISTSTSRYGPSFSEADDSYEQSRDEISTSTVSPYQEIHEELNDEQEKVILNFRNTTKNTCIIQSILLILSSIP